MKYQRIIFKAALALTMMVTAGVAAAESPKENHTGGADLKTEIKEYIQHHLQDSYDFSLYSYTDEQGKHVYVGAPLPVILWDNGLQVFSSAALHHGETVAESNGNFYALAHGKIYKTDAQGTLSYDDHHHITNPKPLDFSMTKSVVAMLLVGALMFFLFRGLAKSYAAHGGVPQGFARLFEPIVLYIRDDIAIPNIGHKHYGKYMSYLLTIFFFVWFLNLMGLTPLGVNVTGNIAVTFGLSLLTFLVTNLTANKNYWGHIFWMPGVPLPMKILLAPIELLGGSHQAVFADDPSMGQYVRRPHRVDEFDRIDVYLSQLDRKLFEFCAFFCVIYIGIARSCATSVYLYHVVFSVFWFCQ